MTESHRFETMAIHAGQDPDPTTGAVMPPVYLTSTYRQAGVGETRGYEYSRTGNPTRHALERCLAALEGGRYGLAFASGMAATDAVLHLLGQGDHVLASHDLYGGTYRLFKAVFERLGLSFTFANASDSDAFLANLTDRTRLVWLETPTNPLLDLCDVEAIASGAHAHASKPLVCVDNTFATPYLQRPLALGADISLHSTTKYLGGHSDVVGGALLTDDEGLAQQLAFLQNAVGAVPGPLDCFLVLRGIKTLPVRMDRHCSNASSLAEHLAGDGRLRRLRYPGHSSHPQHALAQRQMRQGGGMLSFEVEAGESAARTLVESTRLFTLAESLGGVESLIELPAPMTHASVAGSPLAVDPSLVRLSVGLEAIDDLILDLDQALERAHSTG
jgi:cystathionine beta-lyase/cystathionine gamma-synthase